MGAAAALGVAAWEGSRALGRLRLHLLSAKPAQEAEQRFAVWLDNLKYVQEYNAAHTSHWVRRGPLCWRCRPAPDPPLPCQR